MATIFERARSPASPRSWTVSPSSPRRVGSSGAAATASRSCVRPDSSRAHLFATTAWSSAASGHWCAATSRARRIRGVWGAGRSSTPRPALAEGNYVADPDTLRQLEGNGQVVFRYCDASGEPTAGANPNGSINNIAGIVNSSRNVLGMMPHPERCAEPELGGTDGLALFRSLLQTASSVTLR